MFIERQAREERQTKHAMNIILADNTDLTEKYE